MLRQLRKHSKPLVSATIFFFIGTIVLSLVFSILSMWGLGQVPAP